MKKKLKIGLDIDDVLANFYGGMCKRFNKPEIKCDIWDGENICSWIPKGMKYIDKKFWNNLKQLQAPSTINFKVDCYVTSSPKKMLFTRINWLKKHNYPSASVFQAKDKIAILKAMNIDIFVDDKLSTVQAINDAGMLGLQFKPSYMSEEYHDKSKIITHLSEINKFL